MNATARKHIAKAIKEIDASLWGIAPQDQTSSRQARARLIFSLFSDGHELTPEYRVIQSKRGPELSAQALQLIASLE